jgi:hypothetical protein
MAGNSGKELQYYVSEVREGVKNTLQLESGLKEDEAPVAEK